MPAEENVHILELRPCERLGESRHPREQVLRAAHDVTAAGLDVVLEVLLQESIQFRVRCAGAGSLAVPGATSGAKKTAGTW